MKRVKGAIKDHLASICLVVATFLNPLGFDIAFYSVMKVTGSYWVTTGMFYLGSACFFGLYFWLRNRNKKSQNKKEINITKGDDYDNWHPHF